MKKEDDGHYYHLTRHHGLPGVGASAADLARKHTPEAIKVLVEIMRDKTALNSDRLKAVTTILNRGWGRPPEDVTHRLAADSAPLRVRWMTSAEADESFDG